MIFISYHTKVDRVKIHRDLLLLLIAQLMRLISLIQKKDSRLQGQSYPKKEQSQVRASQIY